MKKLLLISVLFSVILIHGQAKIEIQNLKVDKNGLVTWQTKNEKGNTYFKIDEFRWHKWDLIGKVKGKAQGENSYSYLADTTCGLYTLRVTALDTIPYITTDTVNFPDPKKVMFINPDSVTTRIILDTKTKFEIYDSYGNKVIMGCDDDIGVSVLRAGVYYLNYANSTKEFIKRSLKKKTKK